MKECCLFFTITSQPVRPLNAFKFWETQSCFGCNQSWSLCFQAHKDRNGRIVRYEFLEAKKNR